VEEEGEVEREEEEEEKQVLVLKKRRREMNGNWRHLIIYTKAQILFRAVIFQKEEKEEGK